jgi:hypothetical protein
MKKIKIFFGQDTNDLENKINAYLENNEINITSVNMFATESIPGDVSWITVYLLMDWVE